jgi:hypothetical protein
MYSYVQNPSHAFVNSVWGYIALSLPLSLSLSRPAAFLCTLKHHLKHHLFLRHPLQTLT